MTDRDRTSTRVVPFPLRAPDLPTSAPGGGAAPGASLPDDIGNRIAGTAARLNAALKDQRAAAQALRDAVGDLHGAMSTLARSLDIYSMQINAVAARVSVLRQQAITLEALADRAANAQQGTQQGGNFQPA